MIYPGVNLYIPYDDISLTRSPVNDKYQAFMFLNENDDNLSVVKNINFGNKAVTHYLVPTSPAPYRTYMNSTYKEDIKNAGFIPIKSNINELNKFPNKHLYIDTNRYFDTVIERLNVTNFNVPRYKDIFNSYFDFVIKYLPTNTDKVLLYTINLDKPFSDKLLNKKILPLYLDIINSKQDSPDIKFDKIFFIPYSTTKNTKEYILLYDKSKKLNAQKIRSIISKYFYKEDIKLTITPNTDEVIDMEDFDEDEIRNAEVFSESYVSPWDTRSYVVNEFVGAALGAVGRVVAPQFARTAAKWAGRQIGRPIVAAGGAIERQAIKRGAQTAEEILKNNADKVAITARQAIKNKTAGVGRALQANPKMTAGGLGSTGYFTLGDPYNDAKAWYQRRQAANQPPTLAQKAVNTVKANPVAAAGAVGAVAASGAAYVAFKNAQNKKREQWYENGCQNLTGFEKKQCIKHVNNLKLNNLNNLVKQCGGDEECINGLQAEINSVNQAIANNEEVSV